MSGARERGRALGLAGVALAGGLVAVLATRCESGEGAAPREVASSSTVEPERAGSSAELAGVRAFEAGAERGARGAAIAAEARRAASGASAEDAPERVAVRARFVDRRTRIALPGVEVDVLSADGERVRVTSDAEGRVATARRAWPVPVALVVLDPWGGERLALAQDPAVEAEHALGVGTLVRVDFALPPGRARSDFGWAVVLDPRDDGRCGRPLNAVDWRVVCIPERAGCEPERAPLLRIESWDRFWSGAVPRPFDATPVEVVLEPRGELDVRVVDERGARVAGPTELVLLDATGAPLATGTTPEGGALRLRALPPGQAELRARAGHHADTSAPVVVTAGERRRVALVVLPHAIGGRVSGVVTSASGSYRWSATARLEGLGDGGAGWSGERIESLHWGIVDGRRVARFAFEDVPVGRARLTVETRHGLGTEPAELVVEAPAEGFELCIDDGVEFATIALYALDAADGRPLGEFVVTLLDEAGAVLAVGAPSRGRPLSARVRLDGGLAWIVQAPGRDAARGGLGELEEATDAELAGAHRYLRLVARLAPGPARALRVTDEAGAPLAGVALVAGGRELGRSDALGVLEWRAEEGLGAPELAHPGWETVSVEWPPAGVARMRRR